MGQGGQCFAWSLGRSIGPRRGSASWESTGTGASGFILWNVVLRNPQPADRSRYGGRPTSSGPDWGVGWSQLAKGAQGTAAPVIFRRRIKCVFGAHLILFCLHSRAIPLHHSRHIRAKKWHVYGIDSTHHKVATIAAEPHHNVATIHNPLV